MGLESLPSFVGGNWISGAALIAGVAVADVCRDVEKDFEGRMTRLFEKEERTRGLGEHEPRVLCTSLVGTQTAFILSSWPDW